MTASGFITWCSYITRHFSFLGEVQDFSQSANMLAIQNLHCGTSAQRLVTDERVTIQTQSDQDEESSKWKAKEEKTLHFGNRL